MKTAPFNLLVLFAIITNCIVLPHGSKAEFHTNKWDNQINQNLAFCGTTDYQYVSPNKVCVSYYLAETRYDTLIIDAATACAVCAYGGPATCSACSYTQLSRWFHEYATALRGSLAHMADSVKDIAGLWLGEVFDDLLDGGGWFTDYIGGWDIDARAGVMLHCSQECPTPWTCLPQTCMQHQPYIQLKVEKRHYARYIYVQNDHHESIQIAIRYYDPLLDEWTSGCWWTFAPGQAAYLASGGGRVVTTAETIGFYAQTVDGTEIWSGDGSYIRNCGSNTLDFFRWDNIDADNDISISFVAGRHHLGGDGNNGEMMKGLTIGCPFVGNFYKII